MMMKLISTCVVLMVRTITTTHRITGLAGGLVTHISQVAVQMLTQKVLTFDPDNESISPVLKITKRTTRCVRHLRKVQALLPPASSDLEDRDDLLTFSDDEDSDAQYDSSEEDSRMEEERLMYEESEESRSQILQ